MIAFLGMYDMPDLHAANDRLWTLIRQHLGFGPDTLSRGLDPWEIWQSPDLVLAQTCGMPFRTRLHRDVALIGTPDYGVPVARPVTTIRSLLSAPMIPVKPPAILPVAGSPITNRSRNPAGPRR